MHIERLTLQDLHHVQALQPPDWGDIIPNTRMYLQSDFCYAVKAVADGKLVGTGVAILHEQSAWIANMIVHPDYRRQGIGEALTQNVVDYARQHCNMILLIATALGNPVYSRLGFKGDGDYLFFKKGKVHAQIPGQVIPFAEKFKAGVLNIDREATGENRERFLAPYLHQAWVYYDAGEVQGFCIPMLGEGVTLARNQAAGIALMTLNLQQEKPTVVPAGNPAAVNWLAGQGFVADAARKGTYMYLGEKPQRNPHYVFARIGGNVG